MRSIIIIITVFMCVFNISAQENKTFFLGHSLVNFHIPNMVNKLSIAAGNEFSYDANIGIGANLLMHWTNPNSGQGTPWNVTLNQGGYDNFVITEAVPLKGHLQWSKTYRCADSLYQFAKQYNPDIQYYIYETWHCKNSGTPTGCEWDNDDHISWRNRLTLDLPLWEGIADSINLIHEKDMYIIPAGQALARLSDSIQAGRVPGFTSIQQLFTDDIHLTYTGNYFIACVQYAVLQKNTPEGLPNRLTDEWGISYNDYPTPAQALKFQKIAWETILAYPRDGVSGPPLAINVISLVSRINSNGHLEINWNVEDDGEISYFIVEKSIDGKNFSPISNKIYRSAKQVYAHTDNSGDGSPAYYRIKITDIQNNTKYSKTILSKDATGANFSIRSGTVSDKVELISRSDIRSLDYAILNIQGQVIKTQNTLRFQKKDELIIHVEDLLSGIYFLKTIENNSRQSIIKFVKVN